MGVGDIVSADARGISCTFLFRKSEIATTPNYSFLVSQVHTSERRICNIS